MHYNTTSYPTCSDTKSTTWYEVLRYLRLISDTKSKESEANITSAGTGSIPAGFKSISIVKLTANTDSVFVTLSDGSVYEMKEKGEVFSDSSSSSARLPAYNISGTGTIKWHGIK